MDIINLQGRTAMTGTALSVSAYNAIRQYKDISGGSVILTDEMLDGDLLYLRLDGAGPVTFPEWTVFPGSVAPALDSSGVTFIRFEKQGSTLYAFVESGGAAYYENAIDEPPASPSAWNTEFSTMDDADWTTTPGDGWSWVNRSNSDMHAKIVNKRLLFIPSVLRGDVNIALLVKAVPTGDFDVVTKVAYVSGAAAFTKFGLVAYNSSNGKLICTHLGSRGVNEFAACHQHWNTVTGGIPYEDNPRVWVPKLYLRMKRVGTTLYHYYSFNGEAWTAFGDADTESAYIGTGWDKIGLMADSEGSKPVRAYAAWIRDYQAESLPITPF